MKPQFIDAYGGLRCPVFRTWVEISPDLMRTAWLSGEWRTTLLQSPEGVELRGSLRLPSGIFLITGKSGVQFRDCFANVIMLDLFRQFALQQQGKSPRQELLIYKRELLEQPLMEYGVNPLSGDALRAGYEPRLLRSGRRSLQLVDFRDASDEEVQRMLLHAIASVSD